MPDVVSDCLIGASTYLHQITQSSFNPNIQILDGVASGSPYVMEQFIESANPEAQITSVDLANFMTIFGVQGGQIASGVNVIVPYQKRKSGGTFQTGSANMEIQGVASCPVQLVPLSINAPRMGVPTAQGGLHFLSVDGITQPWAGLVNQSLSAQVFEAMYGLGPVYVNGTRVPKQVGWNLNFGVGLSEKQHWDGLPFPSDVFIETAKPSIEFNVEDFDLMASITGGEAITSFVCYLRARVQGGTYGTTGISFTFSSGAIGVPLQLSASETKHGTAGVRVEGYTGTVTTNPLSFSTSASVPSP